MGFLAREASKSANDDGLDVRGIMDSLRPNSGYPFRPRPLSLVVKMAAEIGEDAGGPHELGILVSDADGGGVWTYDYGFDLPAGRRLLTLVIVLHGLEFPERGRYQFNLDLDRGTAATLFMVSLV
jgi:hypothetical protein